MRRSAKKWRAQGLEDALVQIKDEKTRTLLTERAWLPTREDRRDGKESPEAQRMLFTVETHLSWMVDINRSAKTEPKRAHKIAILDALLRAQRQLVAAIQDLDSNTWCDLVLTEETLNLKKCELPEGHSKFAPAVPVAIEELGRAAEELRAILRKQKPDTSKRDKFRDASILLLAATFRDEASFELRDPAVYRKELLAFLRTALKAAGFKAPEPRKVWAKLGRFHLQKPRERVVLEPIEERLARSSRELELLFRKQK
jgi:hypothetical protein